MIISMFIILFFIDRKSANPSAEQLDNSKL